MRYLKFVLPAFLLALSANVSASAVNLINNGSYTTDTSSSLDWIRWDTTKNQSYNYVSGQFGAGGEYDGWQYATFDQAKQFLGSFGITYAPRVSYSWVSSASREQWDDLTSYMGFDLDYGSGSTQRLYGMVESIGSYAQTFAGSASNSSTLVDAQTALLLSNYTKSINYEFLGSFLVRSSEAVVPSAVPVPAAAWLFGSALLGFFGFSRRKANA